MRICKVKATKRIIEMQSNATPGTLIKNALNAGYAQDAVEEFEVDQAGYAAAKNEDPVYIAEKQAVLEAAALAEQKLQAILDNLPSRAAIKTAINAAFSDPKQNAVITKMADVVYWLAVNKAD